MKDSFHKSKYKNVAVNFIFCEKRYSKELEYNLKNSQFAEYLGLNHEGEPIFIQNIDCDFKDSLPALVGVLDKQNVHNCNLFCYIDPFGIKDINADVLKFATDKHFTSSELLINFNSFGFFRVACAMKGYKIKEKDIRDAEGFDNGINKELKSVSETGKYDMLNGVMGTDSWMQIIDDYYESKINGYEAEAKISHLYKKQLREKLKYKYVLDILIRKNESSPPKYRMLYATNHEDGAVIMGNSMRKRKEHLHLIHSQGQRDLFGEEDLSTTADDILNNVCELLSSDAEKRLSKLEAEYYDKYEITYKKMPKILSELEKTGKIKVRREPAFTEKGRPRKFTTESEGNKVFIRLS